MRIRNDLIFVVGLSVSLAGIASATEPAQPSAAVPPAHMVTAPVQAPVAAGVVAPAAPTAPATPVAAAPAAAAAAAAAAAPAAPAAAVAAADEDPMVCKKITETGTLGRKKKLCMPASEWEQHRKSARGVIHKERQNYRGNPCNDRSKHRDKIHRKCHNPPKNEKIEPGGPTKKASQQSRRKTHHCLHCQITLNIS